MKRRLPYERRVLALAFVGALPALALGLALLWTGDFSPRLRWTLTATAVGAWGIAFAALRERLVRPLQTVSNLLAALHEGDYSMRARLGGPDEALGLVAFEVNALGETLREQRLSVLEATTLLRRVMEEIDVAVFAFDSEERLILANRAAERLLDRSADGMRGRSAASLGVADLLKADTPRVADLTFPGGSSRWEVRIRRFRQEGRPHRLLVLSDLSRVLREEERKAWQRLVRVLGHEINNSLTPIRSIAQSLQSALVRRDATAGASAAEGSGAAAARSARAAHGDPDRGAAPGDPDRGAAPSLATADEGVEDLRQGLDVIAGRAEALARFMSSYARLARLPPPSLAPLEVGEWVRRVAGLETRLDVEVRPGPAVEIVADGDQLDQLLINLIDNAVDAALQTDGGVRVGWSVDRRRLDVWVEDDGPGISDTGNLFVPFYTTKEQGSGIGLVLCREIAEAHHGSVTLENRNGVGGCVARLRLPRRRPTPTDRPA